jgi:hypothetical protein
MEAGSMNNKKKQQTPICATCGGNSFKNRITTYPIQLGEKQLNIGRVAVKECLACHHLMPTQRGQDKIARCLATFASLMH